MNVGDLVTWDDTNINGDGVLEGRIRRIEGDYFTIEREAITTKADRTTVSNPAWHSRKSADWPNISLK